ncbi:unnamed protein product [Arctia plantaginis]|uniref:Odorant receptor n=1 Tax=Arctia plantaginis TaxID=874455 RepID=A0A8S0Z3A8_ARCPL|nr:unnamed protein product [Arctia plantaginis]
MGGADYLFYTCCTYITVQFKLLQYDFERIIPSTSSLNQFQEDEVRKNFVDLMVNDIVTIITFLTFLSMGLMQVFFLCFFADMMTSASVEVSTAVYNTRWYLARTTVERQFLLIQTRSLTVACPVVKTEYFDLVQEL